MKAIVLKDWSIKFFLMQIMTALAFAATAQGKGKKIWPEHVKLQYAGGIGFLSIGAGYTNKKEWMETDFYYGYVPKSVGGITIHILTGKASFFPVKPIGKSLQLKPVSLGVLANYTFGKQYFGFSPENYPFDYYSRPTAFRAAAFVGGQLNKKLKNQSLKSIGLYYELITYDTELLSYLDNTRSLDWDDILNLGVGLRIAL